MGDIITVSHLCTRFGTKVIHDNLDLSVQAGEVMGIVGASGSGKSVLLNTLIGLRSPFSGSIMMLGHETTTMSHAQRLFLQQQCGILFQSGALFGSLTVLENIMAPLVEVARVSRHFAETIARVRLEMVGLPQDAALKFPQQLSGGMIKRAGLARALAMDPKIVFLDEPTSGLDPIAANHFDQIILDLQKNLGLTVVMITHDVDSLRTICNRISVLVDQKIITGTLDDMLSSTHPWIHEYFHGARGARSTSAGGHG